MHVVDPFVESSWVDCFVQCQAAALVSSTEEEHTHACLQVAFPEGKDDRCPP